MSPLVSIGALDRSASPSARKRSRRSLSSGVVIGSFLAEQSAQLRLAPLVVNARRSNGDVQDVGGGGDREVLVEHEMQHFPLTGRELLHRGDERLFALGGD